MRTKATVQGAIGLAVAATVETVPVRFAGRGRYRADPAQRCEASFAAQSIRVSAGCDEQGRGDVGVDTEPLEQCGRGLCSEFCDQGVDLSDFLGELAPAADRA